MVTRDLLRSIRNDLPLALVIQRLGVHGPISKHQDGYFRFQCPACGELRATVNPKNNLAHCFCCGENFNTIDLMILQGHDFLPAVTILQRWLVAYHQDLGRGELGKPETSRPTETSRQIGRPTERPR